jgi:pimeloyl-ACP methyl ester carboxylesterase
MFVLSFLFASAFAFAQDTIVVPRGTGPYATSLIIEEWVDSSRLDPFNTSHARRIMTSRFDPVLPSNCNLDQVQYMSNSTAAAEDEILGAYGWPKGLFGRFVLEVCREKYVSKRSGKNETEKWPIVLFSGGLNTTRIWYSHIAQEIASQGFTVVMMDHPYDTDVVEFPNGDVIFGGRVVNDAPQATSLKQGLSVRAEDASFVLDHLSVRTGTTEQVVMFGHSFGGASSATALLNDKRFRAGINIDGSVFGPVVNTSLGSATSPQAFALWGSDGHSSFNDSTWTTFWNSLDGSAYVDYKKEFTVSKSVHNTYTDLGLLVDLAGVRGNLSEIAQALIGPIPGARVSEILSKYISAFFWFTLGKKGEDGVLKRENGEFPEVKLLRG